MTSYPGTLFFLTTLAGTALAAVTSPSIVPPMKPVLEAVDKLGYTTPTEVSYDKGTWEIEVLEKNQPVEVRLDAKTNKVLGSHTDEPHPQLPKSSLTLAEIVDRLEKANYTPIKHLEWEGDEWEAEAFHDSNWHEVHLDTTGKITRDEIDD